MKTHKRTLTPKVLPYILIAPTFIGVSVFSFYPFIKTIISSFSFTDEFGNWSKWAGTTFWKMLFGSDSFYKMLRTTLVFAAMNFIMTVSIAMILALLCTRRTKLSRIYQTLFALPMAVASATASVVWRFILNSEGGLLNTWLGTDIDWLNSTGLALWMVAIVTSWCHIAHSYLFLLAGFRNVPEDVREAAIVDGAGGFVRAVRIMIPMASPQIFYVVFLNIIMALKTFTQINLMTYGGPAGSTTTLMYGIYLRVQKGEYEYGCAMSLIMFLVVFLFTRIQFLFEKKTVHYQ
jgi:sn-glycerol 3-phosphate transport system permease protein